jgi:hypothetical protein
MHGDRHSASIKDLPFLNLSYFFAFLSVIYAHSKGEKRSEEKDLPLNFVLCQFETKFSAATVSGARLTVHYEVNLLTR